MIIVDGKKITIRCSGDITVARRTIDIYVRGSGYFEDLADIVGRWLMIKKYISYFYSVERFKKAIKNLRTILVRVDMQFDSICDRYVPLAKFRVGGVQVDWEKVFSDLEAKVYKVKDYVKAMKMVYDMSSSVAYKRVVAKQLTDEDINNMILDTIDRFVWVCKWSMNVRTVVSNSVFSLINILYSTIFKIIGYYYEGKISEEGMSYAVADLDERIAILNMCLDDLARVSWELKYSYVKLYQLYRLLEDRAKKGESLC